MLMQTTIPKFFVEELSLSYTKIFTAIALCKGVGFAFATKFWISRFSQRSIFPFCSEVAFIAALFPLCLLCGCFSLSFVFVAYLLYGMMQAGSELGFHLSGVHFSRGGDSSLYSSVNVLCVGIRGMVVPMLGTFLYWMTGSFATLCIASFVCLSASFVFGRGPKEEFAASPS